MTRGFGRHSIQPTFASSSPLSQPNLIFRRFQSRTHSSTSSLNFKRPSSSANCASSASSRTYLRRQEAGWPWHFSASPVQLPGRRSPRAAFEPISHLPRQRVEDCGEGGQCRDYRKASFVVSVESGWRLSCGLRATCNGLSVLPGAGDDRPRRRKQGNPSKCGSDSSGSRSLCGRSSACRGRIAEERRSPDASGSCPRRRTDIDRCDIERAGFACCLGICRPGARTH